MKYKDQWLKYDETSVSMNAIAQMIFSISLAWFPQNLPMCHCSTRPLKGTSDSNGQVFRVALYVIDINDKYDVVHSEIVELPWSMPVVDVIEQVTISLQQFKNHYVSTFH